MLINRFFSVKFSSHFSTVHMNLRKEKTNQCSFSIKREIVGKQNILLTESFHQLSYQK